MRKPTCRESIVLFMMFLVPVILHAEPRELYLRNLKVAEQAIKRQKAVSGGAGALSSAVLMQLFGRYYQVGDTWEVAAVHIIPQTMPGGGDLSQEVPGIFKYEVVELKTGASPEVVMKISPIDAYGVKTPDPRVENIRLTIDDNLVQHEKSYLLRERAGSALRVMRAPVGGLKSRLSPLELFPLDAPNVRDGERIDASRLPVLPTSLNVIAARAGYSPDISKAYWFEESDFFGRGNDVLWQRGDPWPAYQKTAGGVSILLPRRTR